MTAIIIIIIFTLLALVNLWHENFQRKMLKKAMDLNDEELQTRFSIVYGELQKHWSIRKAMEYKALLLEKTTRGL